MLTMNDVRTYKRGQQAEAEQMADGKIRQLIGQEEQEADMMQQEAQAGTERSLEEDAMTVLNELQNSENPEAEFEKLPPILQQKVMELMNGGQQAEPAEGEGVPMEAPMAEQAPEAMPEETGYAR